MKSFAYCSLFVLAAFLMGCSGQSSDTNSTIENLNFPQDDGGISLPDGFSALVVADSLGPARHITIDDDGDIYVILRQAKNGNGLVALRDTDGDGKADQKEYFGDIAGTGIQLHNGYLYAATDSSVARYKMNKEELVPSSSPEIVVSGFPKQSQHASKTLAFDNSGNMYVNIGAPSNSCQEEDRTAKSPGQDPCPLLEQHAGIWQFDATKTGQTATADGKRYATGIRNAVGIEWNDKENSLYVTQHGRDQLFQNWPDLYTEKESAELPAEELFKVNEGDNFGWPYSYYDQNKEEIMLAPEYGGDGKKTIAETDKYRGKFEDPVVAFPGHWAPNALEFYSADQFPAKYKNGAFIAFHGSWNRAPQPQEGYKVVFVPLDGDSTSATGNFEEFATGFPGTDEPQPGSAEHRPTGLAIGPDGSLYITDDSKGTVWRVVYTGEGDES